MAIAWFQGGGLSSLCNLTSSYIFLKYHKLWKPNFLKSFKPQGYYTQYPALKELYPELDTVEKNSRK